VVEEAATATAVAVGAEEEDRTPNQSRGMRRKMGCDIFTRNSRDMRLQARLHSPAQDELSQLWSADEHCEGVPPLGAATPYHLTAPEMCSPATSSRGRPTTCAGASTPTSPADLATSSTAGTCSFADPLLDGAAATHSVLMSNPATPSGGVPLAGKEAGLSHGLLKGVIDGFSGVAAVGGGPKGGTSPDYLGLFRSPATRSKGNTRQAKDASRLPPSPSLAKLLNGTVGGGVPLQTLQKDLSPHMSDLATCAELMPLDHDHN